MKYTENISTDEKKRRKSEQQMFLYKNMMGEKNKMLFGRWGNNKMFIVISRTCLRSNNMMLYLYLYALCVYYYVFSAG
jgi:hypothetical protein